MWILISNVASQSRFGVQQEGSSKWSLCSRWGKIASEADIVLALLAVAHHRREDLKFTCDGETLVGLLDGWLTGGRGIFNSV